MRKTGECTPVYYNDIDDKEIIHFSKKTYPVIDNFKCKPFKSKNKMPVDEVDELLEAKQKELKKMKDVSMESNSSTSKKEKKSWEMKVNQKRRLIASYLQRQSDLNLSDACRYTKCSFEMVKRVYEDLLFLGSPAEYHYPNQKKPEVVTDLINSISKVNGTCATVGDLKRIHPVFSRKWISRQLRRTGLRWKMLEKNMKVPKKDDTKSKQVVSVVRHLAQSLINRKVDIYYIDEMHLPLVQTSTRHWTLTHKDNSQEQLMYNRRPVEDTKLSVIAMCSLTSFVAIQVFQKDITADDFLYFLQEALTKVPERSRVTILADNATWHTARSIACTKTFSFLYFNAPRLFQSNAIENCFSFIRADFRRRPLVKSLEEEARLLVKIFFDSANYKRFPGIGRNHLRSLRYLLNTHYTAILNEEQEEQEDY